MIARWLRWAKSRRDIRTDQELAGEIGVARSTVSRWLNGSRVSVALGARDGVYDFLGRCLPRRRTPLTPAEFESGPPKAVR